MKNKTSSGRPEHIGWELWQATFAWKALYEEKMISRGYPWYGEARAQLTRFIPKQGIAQSELVELSQLSKQAVQQQLHELVADGIVRRASDPNDARRKLVQYTRKGLRVFDTANEVKLEIDKRYQTVVGQQRMKALREALAMIIDLPS